jgi:hypothetical protein
VNIVTGLGKGTRILASIPAKATAETDREQGTEGQVA